MRISIIAVEELFFGIENVKIGYKFTDRKTTRYDLQDALGRWLPRIRKIIKNLRTQPINQTSTDHIKTLTT